MQTAPRFAHSAGYTSLCFTGDGGQFVTAGEDGDVRLWDSVDDDDPNSFHVGNAVSAIVAKRDAVYAALDSHIVQTISLPMGTVNGMATRFPATVTHMQLNKTGDYLLAASSDFHIKWTKLDDHSFKEFEGHEAPVLSIALDPKEEFFISTSGDGTVKVWNLTDGSCVRTLNVLPFSNEFDLKKPLSRLAWEPQNAQHFAVPVGKEVHIYNRQPWAVAFSLNSTCVTSPLSICCYSPNGKYMAASSLEGSVYLWEMDSRKFVSELKPDRQLTITSLAWHPQNTHNLLYCDIEGHVSMFSDVLTTKTSTRPNPTEELADSLVDMEADEYLNGNDRDEDLDEELVQIKKPTKPLVFDEDEDNDDGGDVVQIEDEFSRNSDLGALKASCGFDETGQFTLPMDRREAIRQPTPEPSWMPIPTQRPFVSNSTPTGLPERFMKWNQVGIVRQYNNDTETSVEVEFHDTSYHHAIHVDNSVHNYTMADLSYEAVVLASSKSPARVCVTLIGSVDSGKEWDLEMPEGEDILCLCIGANFIAVATDERLVRIMSIGGIQKEIFSVGGPVVSMTASGSKLAVVYHSAMGLTDEHSLSVSMLEVNKSRRSLAIVSTFPLALSSKSSLSWMGFSDEGAFCYMDTKGILRMQNASFNGTWLPIMDAKSHCGGQSDRIWIVSVQEISGEVRGILCKGSKYPPLVPRPTLMVFTWGLPMCELETDKGKLEEICLKARVRHNDISTAEDSERLEEVLGDIQKSELECIVKLFMLACKAERDLRALDVANLMPTAKSIQVLIDLAAKLRRRSLAEKLGQLAREKAAEEASATERKIQSEGERYKRPLVDSYNDDAEDDDVRIDSPADYENRQKFTSIRSIQSPVESPLLKPKPVKLRPSFGNAKNPFRQSENTADTHGAEERGKSVFDNLVVEKPKEKDPIATVTGKGKRKKSLEAVEPAGMKQSRLSFGAKQTSTNKPGGAIASAFTVWLSSTRELLVEEWKTAEGAESVDELELNTFAVKKFKQLSEEEKALWSQQKKLPLTNGDESPSRSNSPPSGTVQETVDKRLASFAYRQTD